jgi:hypothetical protein
VDIETRFVRGNLNSISIGNSKMEDDLPVGLIGTAAVAVPEPITCSRLLCLLLLKDLYSKLLVAQFGIEQALPAEVQV